MSKELTVAEQSRLKSLEAKVDAGITSSLSAGDALRQIRDEKLYRQDYRSFDDYLQERWGCGKRYAYRIISAFEVREKLPEPVASKLRTEGQLRPLTDVPDSKLEEVLDRAIEMADGAPMTSGLLKRAKAEVIEPELKPVDEAADRARRMIPQLVQKLRLQLGNLGVAHRYASVFDEMLREAE